MNDIPRFQTEPGCQPRLAGRAPDAGTDFGNLPARRQQLRSSGAVNRSVYSTAAEHPLVRGVDDGVNVERGDVGADNFNPPHALSANPVERLRELRSTSCLRGYRLAI
jgi:hypothetical protein